MSDITIYKPAGVAVVAVDGDPPVDQSATVAALSAQVATLSAQVSTLTTKISKAQADLA
jgi:CMP-2-keto-3-deoxyoctulosonic acid synthetase